MGFNKAIPFLGLSFAIVLLISSEVAARDLAQTSNENSVAEETNGVNEAQYGGGGYPAGRNGGYPGGGNGGNRGGGGGNRGGGGGGNRGGGGGGGGGGGRCRYGCCGRGRECRCCSYAGEAMEVETLAKPHN